MTESKFSITERILAGAGIVTTITGAFVVGYFNPVTAGFFPVCPLYSVTGILCPGCGLTRGFHALFHGDLLTALHFNAMLPVYLFFFLYFLAALIFICARGRGLNFRTFSPTVIWSFLAVALIFTVSRNLPFYPFTLLAP